jgi:acyl carrier protein
MLMQNQTKDKLIKAIISVFETFDVNQLSPGLLMGDIPDWDSMNSFNLLMALESEFSVDLKDVSLTGKDSLASILKLLENRGVAV